ncbi:hypothetical protein KVT40_000403 [Elsinoe batatas]|uniref:Uncharacterized protein n=1 Tax=Elsinoe batatas TaxID=2601811 RepID=A0A8K0LAW3_9PEZI|nr:hypothetical protein KVT40_000403 [Elsinoe batatas]
MSCSTNPPTDEAEEILARSVEFTSGAPLRSRPSQDSLATTRPVSEPKQSIPIILAESDFHLATLSRLLTTARARSPLDTHTASSARHPPPRATPEAERDALLAKNQQLASALNRAKMERSVSVLAEMQAVQKMKELRRENRDLASVVDLLEKEVDRLSLGVLVAGTTPVESPAGKGKSPTSVEKKAIGGGEDEVGEDENVQTPTKQRPSATITGQGHKSEVNRTEEQQQAEHGSDGVTGGSGSKKGQREG